MANNVTVSLGLKDQLTSPLKGVMAGVRSEMSNLGGVSQGITSSISGMTAGFIGLAAAIGASALAMLGFQNGVGKAASLETMMIASAGDVATLVGTTYSDAMKSVKDIQKEVVTMAAALPGETEGFGAIANAVTASIALGSKGDLKQMKEDVVEVTKVLGLLAATKKVDMNLAASASNKFMSGSTSIAELFAINDVFQKNPLFKKYLEEQLSIVGKTTKQWGSLDQELRNKVVVAAGKRAFSVETLRKFEGTADSLIQSIKTSLFDQQVGIFGFLRDIKGLDGKNALSRVAVFLGSIQTLAESIGDAGVNFDPMLEIGKSLNYLSDVLYSVNLGITKGDWRGLKQMLSGMWKGVLNIPYTLAAAFNSVVDVFKNIDWKTLGTYMSEMLTDFSTALRGVDFKGLGDGIGKMISGILTNRELMESLATTLKGVMNGFAEVLGATLVASVKGIGQAVMDSIAKPVNGFKSGVGMKEEALPFGTKENPKMPGDLKPLPQLQSNNSSTSTQQGAFAPVINVTGSSSDPQQMADYIMTALSSRFTEYKQSILT